MAANTGRRIQISASFCMRTALPGADARRLQDFDRLPAGQVAGLEDDGFTGLHPFEDLDLLVRKSLLSRWDHATLLAPDDPLGPAIAAVQSEAPDRVVLLPGSPSVETMTKEAWAAIERALPTRVRLERVAIRETPTCGSAISRSGRVDGS